MPLLFIPRPNMSEMRRLPSARTSCAINYPDAKASTHRQTTRARMTDRDDPRSSSNRPNGRAAPETPSEGDARSRRSASAEGLSAIEDAIQNSRRYYNAIVRDLNTQIESFPANLLASNFGFAKKDFFELEDIAQRQAPRVSFAS